MKYKVGDKFLMEIEIFGINEIDTSFPYRVSIHGPDWSEEALDKLRRPDDMTAEEAWKMVREICNMDCEKICEIFGTINMNSILNNNPDPRQAKAKIEAWEPARKIEVGDEIHVICERCTKKDIYYFVTKDPKISNNGYVEGIDKNGEWHSLRRSEVKKTGRHIEIQGLLSQIGGGKED